MKNEYDYLNDVKMDFSVYEERENTMNKKKMNKKVFVIAACLAVFAVTTAFASGLVGNIIKTIETGYNTYTQVDPEAPQPIPDVLKGKLFDENGVAIESMKRGDLDKLYDEAGNKITEEMFAEMIEEATGTLVKTDSDPAAKEKDFGSIEKAEEITNFDIKVPEYLPEGYELARVYTYADDDGSVSGDYMTILYKNDNGKTITIFERILNEETSFEMGTESEIKEITINGRKAALIGGTTLGLETSDSVSVSIHTHGNVSEAELIKMAESI